MLLRDIYRTLNRLKTLTANDEGVINEQFLHFEAGTRRAEIQKWLESQNMHYGKAAGMFSQFLSIDRIEDQARKNLLVAVAMNKSLHKEVVDTYSALAQQGQYESHLDYIFRCMRIDFERGEQLSIFPEISLKAWRDAENEIALRTEIEREAKLDAERGAIQRERGARPRA